MAGEGRRILLVDDNADQLRLLCLLLDLRGHTLECLTDPLLALDTAASFKPEAAVLDIGMPALDGYELARLLRTAMGRSVHLIALSGYTLPEYQARSHAAGFDIHLVKGISDVESIEQALRDLDARKARAV